MTDTHAPWVDIAKLPNRCIVCHGYGVIIGRFPQRESALVRDPQLGVDVVSVRTVREDSSIDCDHCNGSGEEPTAA